MHERDALGRADVTDAVLGAKVASLWGVPHVDLVSSTTSPVAYDLPSITTAARTWVSGVADAGSGPAEFRFFVKQVQHWRRSPLFASVPPEVREWAATTVPWQAEPLAYRSRLRDLLPDGLSMARCFGVHDLDDESRSIWLEEVDAVDTTWTDEVYAEAARLLGRLAGSSGVAELAALDPLPWHIDHFVQGRLAHGVIPMLLADDVWRHPLVAATFDERLRDRLREVAGRAGALGAEHASLPSAASHGDACPGNLLRVAGTEGFVLIDFGFWRPQPLGHDLGQLVAGDIQLGARGAEDVAALDALVLDAYLDGLADEGHRADADVVRRGHAVSMMLFSGLPSVPFDLLGAPPDERLHDLCAARAALATYCLDLLDETAP